MNKIIHISQKDLIHLAVSLRATYLLPDFVEQIKSYTIVGISKSRGRLTGLLLKDRYGHYTAKFAPRGGTIFD